jgi:hypothetical protein
MKKNYMKPSMREVLIRQRYHLLQGSNVPLKAVNTNMTETPLIFDPNNATSSETARGREDNSWDDWEDEWDE